MPHRRHGASREDIEELIASDDSADWAVAYDWAQENNDTELLMHLEVANALEIAPNYMRLRESRNFDNVYDAKVGRNEYTIAIDLDTAEAMAVEHVTDELKSEPEIFNQSFIEQHIDQKALKEYVYDAHMEDPYVEELASYQVEDFWQLATQLDVVEVVPRRGRDGDLKLPTQKQVQAVQEAYAEDRSQDPMEFFIDMYGRNDAIKHAVEAVGIDINAAAQDAIRTDGWQHFLAHYDGNSYETTSGFVYWRTN